MPTEYQRDTYTISTDKSRLDINVLYDFLHTCYWSPGIPKATIQKGIEHSMCFGMYDGNAQIGFARVITDYTTFGYLCDVFILEQYRSKGLAKWLMRCVMSHPDLQGFRRWMLLTRDAHKLYSGVGFTP